MDRSRNPSRGILCVALSCVNDGRRHAAHVGAVEIARMPGKSGGRALETATERRLSRTRAPVGTPRKAVTGMLGLLKCRGAREGECDEARGKSAWVVGEVVG